uniref:Uncharacterized protein LOC104240481 n=1 Tax=Nicotiana sylvestris TaxID=4096 RepID=A0A1U7Y303_NICSY|nr:PREDICTED: uncharacterized protein LOC104240481 [Nicotiana sylvestris]
MQKTYDSVEWRYIEQVLRTLNFPEIFVRWIMVCISTVTYSVFINGRPKNSFEAKKGLRQGDPLSPFLFVLAIEYLSRSLKTLKEDKKFKYQPRCAKFNLVQLGFADDLLLFCRGEVQSVQILHQHFQKFSAASGLVANPNKSSIYFGGVNQAIQKSIMEVLWFNKGELSFRYLGVPLSTKRLSAIQCEPLIEKMLHRIQNWTTKYLAYAGDAEPTKKALISWERLCSPKAAGGLNFIDVELWNKAVICKLIWNICTTKEKLWVHWVHTYYVKDQAVWNVKPKNASWAIQKIFQAKKYFTRAGMTEHDVQLMTKCSIKGIYRSLQGLCQKVTWRKLVCNNQGQPKWIFILRLALQQRLATKDRLIRWGIDMDKTCLLCNKENETMQHIFFKCEITGKVWDGLLRWQGIQRSHKNWQDEIAWMEKMAKGKSARPAICRIILAAAIYHCWQERNFVTFQKKRRTTIALTKLIIQEVHVRAARFPYLDKINYDIPGFVGMFGSGLEGLERGNCRCKAAEAKEGYLVRLRKTWAEDAGSVSQTQQIDCVCGFAWQKTPARGRGRYLDSRCLYTRIGGTRTPDTGGTTSPAVAPAQDYMVSVMPDDEQCRLEMFGRLQTLTFSGADDDTVQLDGGLTYDVEPMAILGRQVRKLGSKDIASVKIRLSLYDVIGSIGMFGCGLASYRVRGRRSEGGVTGAAKEDLGRGRMCYGIPAPAVVVEADPRAQDCQMDRRYGIAGQKNTSSSFCLSFSIFELRSLEESPKFGLDTYLVGALTLLPAPRVQIQAMPVIVAVAN